MKWSFFELIPFAVLGIFGGMIGSFFIWANVKWCLFRKSNKLLGQNPIREVLVIAAITSAIQYSNPYTRKSASALIKQVCLMY